MGFCSSSRSYGSVSVTAGTRYGSPAVMFPRMKFTGALMSRFPGMRSFTSSRVSGELRTEVCFSLSPVLLCWQSDGGTPAAGPSGGALMSAGAAMMLGGVAQMLTPVAKQPDMSRGEEEKGNTYFSNLENTVAQGVAVPVAYGRIMCGSRVISQSIEIMDDSDGTNIDAGKHGG